MGQDLEKLRKFALISAVILFSYSVAGIQFADNEKVSLLGIPFTISNPELLPIGLIFISLYGVF